MGGIKSNDVELDHAYLLCASSLVTVSLASLVLGLITAGVIVLSRHCHINPDNVATPIAASLGDITSLALLSWVSTLLYESIGNPVISYPHAKSELIVSVLLYRNTRLAGASHNSWLYISNSSLGLDSKEKLKYKRSSVPRMDAGNGCHVDKLRGRTHPGFYGVQI